MLKVGYLPLDERPCNYIYPQRIAEESGCIELAAPAMQLLGDKKKPADVYMLHEWLEQQSRDSSHMIISIDMLVYGGIVPSRLHRLTEDECAGRLDVLRKLKQDNPGLVIYAFNLITRVPAYDSDDEEPDYYAQYGKSIFRCGWLEDAINCGKAGDGDEAELQNLKKSIPGDILEDYYRRRKVNHFINRRSIQLAAEGIIDFLIIPLDDCAEYGFSATEQRNLRRDIEMLGIQEKVYMYPGADEIGCTLVARACNSLLGTMPKVFLRYSSIFEGQLIPRYEDRPVGESIKYHIIAAGGLPVYNPDHADFILMVNSTTAATFEMGEAPRALVDRHRSYNTNRNLVEFMLALKYYLDSGKKCAIADVAYGNGADAELLEMLGRNNLLERLLAYAGWNTPGNTMGTVISHAMVRCMQSHARSSRFLAERLLEDWGYMSIIRSRLAEEAEKLGVTYFDIRAEQDGMVKSAGRQLEEFFNTRLGAMARNYEIDRVYFPWKRLFEIGIALKERKI